MPATSCPKCQGRMEVGVIPDIGHANHMHVSTWLEGELESRRGPTVSAFGLLRALALNEPAPILGRAWFLRAFQAALSMPCAIQS